jgi:hypothetical protein
MTKHPRIPTRKQVRAMNEKELKVLENKYRIAAKRQGLILMKSRLRDPRAAGYGTYMLVEEWSNTFAVWGLDSGYGLDLVDVAEALSGKDITS